MRLPLLRFDFGYQDTIHPYNNLRRYFEAKKLPKSIAVQGIWRNLICLMIHKCQANYPDMQWMVSFIQFAKNIQQSKN